MELAEGTDAGVNHKKKRRQSSENVSFVPRAQIQIKFLCRVLECVLLLVSNQYFSIQTRYTQSTSGR